MDHLYSRVMGASQRVHHLAPDARPPPPANEAIVAGGGGTKAVRQVPLWRPGPQHRKNAVEYRAVVHPCYPTRLVRQHWLDGRPFEVGKFTAQDFEASQLGN